MEEVLKDGIINTINQIQDYGIKIRMITGNSMQNAISIAKKCHIL